MVCVEAEKVVCPYSPTYRFPQGSRSVPVLMADADMHGPQVITVYAASLVPCLCTYIAHLQVAGHVSGSPLLACLLICTHLGSRCRRRGES